MLQVLLVIPNPYPPQLLMPLVPRLDLSLPPVLLLISIVMPVGLPVPLLVPAMLIPLLLWDLHLDMPLLVLVRKALVSAGYGYGSVVSTGCA